jgi:hypothetical protein
VTLATKQFARFQLLAAIAFSAAAATAQSAGYPARPKDECIHVAGYIEMRHAFEDVVKRRDIQALTAMVYPTIQYEIGGPEGKADFIAAWQFAQGKASPIWPQLEKLLRLGCYAESDRQVMMPHMVLLDPHWGDDRISEKALILGESVNLRAKPNNSAASRALLSWEFVKIADGEQPAGWTMVTSRGGKTGYVSNDFLRAYLDYRIGFIRQNNVWSINMMISGD